MGKPSKMCEHVGPWRPWYYLFPDRSEPDTDWTCEGQTQMTETKRVTCPVCKRRVKADIRAGHDGDVVWRVPPHKRKMWWKKKRKRERKGK